MERNERTPQTLLNIGQRFSKNIPRRIFKEGGDAGGGAFSATPPICSIPVMHYWNPSFRLDLLL